MTESFFLRLGLACERLIIRRSQCTRQVVEIKKRKQTSITNFLSVEMGRRIKMFGSGAGIDGRIEATA